MRACARRRRQRRGLRGVIIGFQAVNRPGAERVHVHVQLLRLGKEFSILHRRIESRDQRSLTVKLEHVLEAGKYPVAKGPGKSAQAWTWDNPGDVKAVWKLLQKFDDALRLTGTECLDGFDVDKLQYARR